MTTYLLRVNLDIKERDFKNQLRFKLAASSVKFLSKKSNKVVILSHLGRPKSRDKKLSLKYFSQGLSQATGRKIKFISHFDFKRIKNEINHAPGGSIFLLENLRFLPGEIKNSQKLARELAALGSRYINDDFATSHRIDASIVGITKFVSGREGPVLKREIRILEKTRKESRRPFILILGGGPKMTEKIVTAQYLFPKVDHILFGSYILQPKLIKIKKQLLRNKKVVAPIDWRTDKNKILDIGPETAKFYSRIIGGARTIIWNGPMGYSENKKFAKGTTEIATAVIRNKKALTIIGGVETIASLPIRPTKQEYGKIFLSTGGGAMLEFLAGKKLPALKALEK